MELVFWYVNLKTVKINLILVREKKEACHGPSLSSGRRRSSSGFTLMELLLAIAIIGILAAGGLAAYTGSFNKTRDARRKADLNQLSKALEGYHLDFGVYPGSCNGQVYGCDGAACTWGGPFTNASKVYMPALPDDPAQAQNFVYAVSDDQKSFQLYARLENLEDPQVETGGYGFTCTTDALDCNYGISSSDITMSTALNDSTECP